MSYDDDYGVDRIKKQSPVSSYCSIKVRRMLKKKSPFLLGTLIFHFYFPFQFKLCGNQLVGMLNLICSMRFDGKLVGEMDLGAWTLSIFACE
jgi:hypothetical protein